MLLAKTALAGVVDLQISSTAFWSNNLNSISIMQPLLTVSNLEYEAWYDTNMDVYFTVRNLTSNALTQYGPWGTIHAPFGDEHRTIAFQFDKNGYTHLLNGMHGDSLGTYYHTSTIPWSVNSWSGQLFFGPQPTNSDRGGPGNVAATYPFFSKNPTSGELFEMWRDGASGFGDQIFLWWNTANSTWTNAPGLGTNMIIDGIGSSTSPYMQGPPLYDASGNLWFFWCESTAGGAVNTNQYGMYYDGAHMRAPNGTILTMPVTITTGPIILNMVDSSQSATPYQQRAFIQGNVCFVPFTHTNGAGFVQVHVLENSASVGTFVDHTLSSFTVTNTLNSQSYASAIGSTSGPVYVVVENNQDATNSLNVYASANNFTTWTTMAIVTNRYAPNFAPVFDPVLATQGRFVCPFMFADDILYGVTYAASLPYRQNLWLEEMFFAPPPVIFINNLTVGSLK